MFVLRALEDVWVDGDTPERDAHPVSTFGSIPGAKTDLVGSDDIEDRAIVVVSHQRSSILNSSMR
jgi:hypothetical protein